MYLHQHGERRTGRRAWIWRGHIRVVLNLMQRAVRDYREDRHPSASWDLPSSTRPKVTVRFQLALE
jgi:hypothetical protein